MIVHYLPMPGHGSACDPAVTSPVSPNLINVTCRSCLRLPPEPRELGDFAWMMTRFGPSCLLMIVIIATVWGR